jgi:membrane protein
VLPGAFIAAVAWEFMLQAFSWYTATYANYARLYGSLSSLILLMLWFNYGAQILLLGAECSAVLQKHRFEKVQKNGPTDS